MEKYILKNKLGSIIIYRNNDKVYMCLNLDPIDTKNNTFRYDGKYTDKDTNKSYFINVKISTNNSVQTNYLKQIGIHNIQTESRDVKDSLSMNLIKFIAYKNNIRAEIKLPIRALTHNYEDNSNHVKRLGCISIHDKHGNCGVTQVFSGGLVSPR